MNIADKRLSGYIAQRPVLRYFIENKLITHTRLSKNILYQIELYFNREINPKKLDASLLRYSRSHSVTYKLFQADIIVKSLTIQSALCLINYNCSGNHRGLTDRLKELAWNKIPVCGFSAIDNECSFIVDQDKYDLVQSLFADDIPSGKYLNLSMVTLTLGAIDAQTRLALKPYLLQRLAMEGITLKLINATSHEFSVLVDNHTTDLTFQTMMSAMSNIRCSEDPR